MALYLRPSEFQLAVGDAIPRRLSGLVEDTVFQETLERAGVYGDAWFAPITERLDAPSIGRGGEARVRIEARTSTPGEVSIVEAQVLDTGAGLYVHAGTTNETTTAQLQTAAAPFDAYYIEPLAPTLDASAPTAVNISTAPPPTIIDASQVDPGPDPYVVRIDPVYDPYVPATYEETLAVFEVFDPSYSSTIQHVNPDGSTQDLSALWLI